MGDLNHKLLKRMTIEELFEYAEIQSIDLKMTFDEAKDNHVTKASIISSLL